MKLVWDQVGERLYETGVRNGILFVLNNNGTYPLGVAWNGLTALTESPSGAEETPLYANDGKYLSLMSAEEFAGTIEAYTYPDEFGVCDGSAEIAPGIIVGQQNRKSFGLAYRTALGNDIEGSEFGYKLHLIYGGKIAPSEKGYTTINDSPEAITFSWAMSTTPVSVTGHKSTSTVTLDSTKVDPAKLTILETILQGSEGIDPRLPLPDEIAALFAEDAPSAIALSTSLPADAATAVVVSANVVLTFNNKILKESIVLMTAAGVLVPFAKTWDATGKIMTIDPTTNLAAATVFLVVVNTVVDVYSQTLATVVRKFTTA